MSEIPTISVVKDEEDLDEVGKGDINGTIDDHTDIEDLESNDEEEKSTCLLSTKNNMKESQCHVATDVEDYNDSGSDEQFSEFQPIQKVSLQEFLDDGITEETTSNNITHGTTQVKSGNILSAKKVIDDCPTDYDNYSISSDEDNFEKKSICFDFNPINLDSENIEDHVDQLRKTEEELSLSDYIEYKDENKQEFTEDESFEMSGKEILDEYTSSEGDSIKDYYSAVDILLISNKCNSKATFDFKSSTYIDVSPNYEEPLTDTEKIELSAAEDSEREVFIPIPKTTVIDSENSATDIDNISLSDDINIIDDSYTVNYENLPNSHREMVLIKEDENGDPKTNVIAMENNFRFGFTDNFCDEKLTDIEDISSASEEKGLENYVALLSENIISLESKRNENIDNLTDTEEIFASGLVRRKKYKSKIQNKSKLKENIDDSFNEICTVVYEKSANWFNIDKEKDNIKSSCSESHTDVEYVEEENFKAKELNQADNYKTETLNVQADIQSSQDTGGQIPQHDCTVAYKKIYPKPTPRTCIAETEIIPVVDKFHVPQYVKIVSQNIGTGTELPIPKPRQDKTIATEQLDNETSQNFVSKMSEYGEHGTYSQKQFISTHRKLASIELPLDCEIENENLKEIEMISADKFASIVSESETFGATAQAVLDTAVTKQSEIEQKNKVYKKEHLFVCSHEDNSDSLEITTKFVVPHEPHEQCENENSLETYEQNLQTNFYIGESSTNIIQKSKRQKEGEDCEEDNFLSVEKNGLGEERKFKSDELAVVSTTDKAFSDVELDSKVIRQGSETRNDLLEIETESKKPPEDIYKIVLEITPHIDKPITMETVRVDDIHLENTKGEYEIIEQKKTSLVEKKSIKLDLLLDKSEIELSEKSCGATNTKLSCSTTDTCETIAFIPDVFLVERTLEEVQLSLDAAKEELIQVVRDGKSIKQSPSEFEFKTISHVKASISQCIEQGEQKDYRQINSVLCDIPESRGSQVEEKTDSEIKSDCSKTCVLDLSTFFEANQHNITKPISPSNRWSLELDNSSSSDSYYKSVSRPCSSEFDTVQTFHTSSEYHTALDATICRGSTEYVTAVSTFNGKTISSHESMRSLSSETSGNLGSVDKSDLSETLVASIGDPNFDIEDDDSEVLDENREILSAESSENDKQQNFMKRSQEMIFTKEKDMIEPVIRISSKTEHFQYISDQPSDEKKLSSSLESCILSTSSPSTVKNVEVLIGSEGSLADMNTIISITEDDISVHEDRNEYNYNMLLGKESGIGDINLRTDKPKRGGHKRNESALLCTDLLLDLLDDQSDNADKDTNTGKNEMAEDHKASESESDHDPYESEYSRAFKSPSQRKKRKEKRHTEIFDQSPEHITCISPLVTQTIIEDIVTEEVESHTIEEGKRPSQNMHDYSNIPDITVTEEMMSKDEQIYAIPDSILYKVKTQDELNKVGDSPIQRSNEEASSFSEEQFNELVQQQYKQKLADLHEYHEYETSGPDSPDSFEIVDQPDLSDEFVIIEEVAKEASELDLGGKSIKINSNKVTQKHDEEVEQILIKSAPATTTLGSQILRDDLNFDFEESPPQSSGQTERKSPEIDSNKKWVEMQLSDHAAQLRYPYELERGVLEDIKEEDGEFEVGSSRINSFKNSFSSTPDYDVLAGRKYFSKTEHDEISMNSLQEFESLEQAISLENRRIYQGSVDSNNGSFTRRYMIRNAAGDDISLSSLKEFEGLENACIEAHLIEIKAKEEAALLLSRSDESNNSNNGNENPQVLVTTRVKTLDTQSIPKDKTETIIGLKLEDCEEPKNCTIYKFIDKIVCEADLIKSKFDDFLSEQGSADSLDINKSIEVATSSIDSFDISKDMTTKSDIDSLDPISVSINQDESVDSLEPEPIPSLPNLKTESINQAEVKHVIAMGTTSTVSSITSATSKICIGFSNDSLNFCGEQISKSVITDSIASDASVTHLDDSSEVENNQFLLQSNYIEELSSDEVITEETIALVKIVENSANDVQTNSV